MNTTNKNQISDTSNNLDEIRKKLSGLFDEVMESYFERFDENSDRITNLVLLHASLKQSVDFRSHPSLDDILRTSIVFTHASLEDFLRTLASELLPLANEDALNQIPLKGLNTSGRAEKFLLGNLACFRGKLVDDVIHESVIGSLQRSTFNNTNEIAQLLQSLGINVPEVNRSFPKIEELMRRRHLIVHRADKIGETNLGKDDVLDVDPSKVIDWLKAVLELIGNILSQAAVELVLLKLPKEKEGNNLNQPPTPPQSS